MQLRLRKKYIRREITNGFGKINLKDRGFMFMQTCRENWENKLRQLQLRKSPCIPFTSYQNQNAQVCCQSQRLCSRPWFPEDSSWTHSPSVPTIPDSVIFLSLTTSSTNWLTISSSTSAIWLEFRRATSLRPPSRWVWIEKKDLLFIITKELFSDSLGNFLYGRTLDF